MPYGKPTLEEAHLYFQEALHLKAEIEAILKSRP
jgi:hypothetical protein